MFWEILAWVGMGVPLWLLLSYSQARWLESFVPRMAVWPAVSILIAARDEAAALPACLASLGALDYPDLEILFVNDRSADATGDVLESSRVPGLRVIHVSELPDGWMGKNHALWLAGREARGEYLLFSDADVVFAPDTLRHAVQACHDLRADHLVAAPHLIQRGFWEQVFVAHFVALFGMNYQPGWVWLPFPYPYVGIGAFNMVRATAYHACGGHRNLRMSVLDDTGLGKLLKRHGYRQRFISAAHHVRVHWTSGLSGIIGGLEKNVYGAFGYRLPLLLGAVSASLLTALTPFVLVATGRGRLALLLTLVITLCSAVYGRKFGAARWAGLACPLGALLIAWVMLRAAWLTERRGGVRWRETFYPLTELRAFRSAKTSEAGPRKHSS